MTAASRALSTEHNKSAVFHQNHLYYNLSAIILQKGRTLSKKRNFLEFLGTIENFWRILDISKRILELFPRKFRKDFDVTSRCHASKKCLDDNKPKCHLKVDSHCFKLHPSYLISLDLSDVAKFSGLNPTGPYVSLEKVKQIFVLCSPTP